MPQRRGARQGLTPARDACPVHGPGGRTFARHGTYGRHTPWGPARIACHYCRAAETTFSLLSDCLAAHLTGTLAELEDSAVRAERTDIAQATHSCRPISSHFAAGMKRWFSDIFEEAGPSQFRLKVRAGLDAGSYRRYEERLLGDSAKQDRPVLLVIDEIPIFLKRLP